MSVLKIKNEYGDWETIRSIKGEKGDAGDAGSVDDSLSPTSTLPVQNRAIYYAVQGLQSQLSAYDGEISRVDGRVDATNADVAAEGVRISAITRNITNIGNTLDYHWQTIVAQEQAVEDLGNEVDTKADASVVETLQSDIESVEQTVESHTTQIQENASSIETLGTEIDAKADETAVSNLQTTVDGLTNVLKVNGNTLTIASPNIVLDGAANVKQGLNNSPLYRTTHAITNISISANSYKDGTLNITQPGYYPMAIAGWSNSSTHSVVSSLYLSNASSGSATINYRVKETNNTSQSAFTLTVHVLWFKYAAAK